MKRGLTSKLPPALRNTLMVLGLVVVVLCLLGFALVSSAGFDGGWVGWAIAGLSLSVFCTLAVLLEWFHTFKFSTVVKVNLFLAIALHTGTHIALMAYFRNGDDVMRLRAVGFSFALYPAVVLLVAVRDGV